jgi:hypothetical protein
MNFRAHPVAVGPALTTSDVDVGLAGEETAGGDGSCGAFESGGGVVADAGGSLAWANRSTLAPRCESPTAIAARPFGVAEAAWQNKISPVAAIIFQQIFPTQPLLVKLMARAALAGPGMFGPGLPWNRKDP